MRLGHMEGRHANRHSVTVDILPFLRVLRLERLVGEREGAGVRFPCDERGLPFQHRRELFLCLDDRHDEVVDLEVDLLSHLLHPTDDLPRVGLGLQLGRHS